MRTPLQPDRVLRVVGATGNNLRADDLRNPYSDEFDLGIARDVGNGWGIDATFTFSGDDALSLRVLVDGQPHFIWNADRTETRPAVAAGFPDVEQQGGPLLPSLAVSASWTGPAPAGADVWIVLSTTACGFAGTGCEVSRSFRLGAQAGSEDATFVVNEVHTGAYFALLLVDNNGNFATTGFPDSGDVISLPDRPLSVDADGGTLAINASIVR